MRASVLVCSVCALLVLGLLLFRSLDSSSTKILYGLLYKFGTFVGYFAVIFVWTNLIRSWLWLPIQKAAVSLAPLVESATDLGEGIRDLYLSIYGLLQQLPDKVLQRLGWLYLYPIDTKIKAQETNDSPWNDSDLWSFIESENGEPIPRKEDAVATETSTIPRPQPQTPELSQDPVQPATPTTAENPPATTPATPTDPEPPCDPLTLRARRSPPRSPTIKDNLYQIQKLKAQMDNPKSPPSPNKNTKIKAANPFATARHRLTRHHQQQQGSTTVVDGGEDFLPTPDLDHEDLWSDESEAGDWDQPLVSTAVPTQAVRERWAMVFENARDKDEELDRFEAALGGGDGANGS
ncbi:MAG: hypothetical protein Q9168_002781 [Polycauliona sp. 1 TL-2023]